MIKEPKQEKEEKQYQQLKENFLKTIDRLLKKDQFIHEILRDLPSKKDRNTKALDKVSSWFSTLGFTIQNPITTFKAIDVWLDLKNDVKALSEILNGKKEYDPTNLPFLLKILKDKDMIDYLKSDTKIKEFQNIADQILPIIYDSVVKNLGDPKELAKKASSIEKKEKKLPELKKELTILQDKPKQPLTKKDNERLREIQKKISKLQDIKSDIEIAEIIIQLKEAKLDKKFIEKEVNPIISNIVENSLKNSQNILSIMESYVQYKNSPDENVKSEVLSNIIDKINISEIINTELLDQFFKKNSQDLINLTLAVASSNQNIEALVTKYIGKGPLVEESLRLLSNLAINLFAEPVKLSELFSSRLKPIIQNSLFSSITKESSLEKVRKLDGESNDLKLNFVRKIFDLYNGPVLKVLVKDLSTLLANNQEQLQKALPLIIPKGLEFVERKTKEKIAKFDHKLDKEDLRKILLPKPLQFIENVNSDFYANLVPTLTRIIKILDKNFDKLKEIYGKVDKKNILNQTNISLIITIIDKDIISLITSDIPKFINENKQSLSTIVEAAFNNIPAIKGNLKKLNMSEEIAHNLAMDSISAVSNILSAKSKDFVTIIDSVKKITKQNANINMANFSNSNQRDLIKITKAFCSFVNAEPFQQLILSNLNLLKTIPQLSEVQAVLSKINVPELENLAKNSFSLFNSLTQNLFSNEDALLDLIDQTQKLFADENLSLKTGVEKFIGYFMGFKSKNQAFNNSLNIDIPNFLINNSSDIGKILDGFFNQSKLGRNLHLQGEKLLKDFSSRVPQFVEIAELYAKHNYSKMIIKAIPAIFDKKVILTGLSIFANFIKYNFQENLLPNFFRRAFAETEIKDAIFQSQKDFKPSSDKRFDLGENLEKLSSKNNKIADYSLKNRNLRGIKFSAAEEINFNNRKIENFNFNDGLFENKSFANSKIINTSFKDAKFEDSVDFSGTIIDAETLKTLIPAIRKHNKSSNVKIELNNVKIIGDISEVSLKDIKFHNLDLSKAKISSIDKTGKKFTTEFSKSTSFVRKDILEIYKREDEAIKKSLKGLDPETSINIKSLRKKINQKLQESSIVEIVEKLEQNQKELKNIIKESVNNIKPEENTNEIIASNVVSHLLKNTAKINIPKR